MPLGSKPSAALLPPTLVIICGLPGSGKTTHAHHLEIRMNAVRFCPDEWMLAFGIALGDERRRDDVEQFQWSMAKRLLSLGQTVLIEWGTWGGGERNRLREEAKSLGARVELHYLSAPLDVLLERVHRRGMEDPPITRQDLELWSSRIQVPTDAEKKLFDRSLTVGG